MKRVLIFPVFLLFFSCSAPNNKYGTYGAQNSNSSDTMFVTGESAIFFTIASWEYDGMAKTREDSLEIDEVLGDFYCYSKIVMDSLSKRGIKNALTSKPILKIIDNNGKATIFTRANKEHIVGFILTNGKKELYYHYGVTTDRDMFDMVGKYFKKR
jgi:hypothetical protein